MIKDVIRAGLIKRLHVDRLILKRNRERGENTPAVTVQTSRGSFKARRVEIRGPSVLMQSRRPLKCGARAWVETRAEVVLIS